MALANMPEDDTPDPSNTCPMCKGYRHISNSAGYVTCRFCEMTGRVGHKAPPPPPKRKRKGNR